MKMLQLVIFFIFVTNCSKQSTVETLIGSKMRINSYTETCTGIIQMECLLIQQGNAIGSENWVLFYDSIDGFTFVPGYIYEIDVTISEINFPPADTSGLKYTLNRILKKTKVD